MTKKVKVPSKEQKLQEKLLMYQILKSSVEQQLQQSTAIGNKILELEITKHAIKDVIKTKSNEELLFPLGNGFFANGKSSGSKKILMDLGAGIYAMKGSEEAEKYLEKKEKELQGQNDKMQKEMNKAIEKMNEIAPELQRMIEQAQK